MSLYTLAIVLCLSSLEPCRPMERVIGDCSYQSVQAALAKVIIEHPGARIRRFACLKGMPI